jgi:hypothetical protein
MVTISTFLNFPSFSFTSSDFSPLANMIRQRPRWNQEDQHFASFLSTLQDPDWNSHCRTGRPTFRQCTTGSCMIVRDVFHVLGIAHRVDQDSLNDDIHFPRRYRQDRKYTHQNNQKI